MVGPGAGFQKWIGSKASTALLDVWNETALTSVETDERYEQTCRVLFDAYLPQTDVAGWLVGLAVLAESLPLALTVSDCMVAGFPLVYVNSKFTDVTGYTKRDCMGRNCRFLQGPGTSPEHGQHLLDTLRNGEDSQTMLLNYRKSGEPFENLLTMAFVHDSLGRRRFCLGFQLDLTGLQSDPGPWGKERLATEAGFALMAESRAKMSKLIKMLPKQIEVPVPMTPSTSSAMSVSQSPWSCPQLAALANALGVAMPSTDGAEWCTAFYSLLEHASDAVIVVDMCVPMLPIAFANQAFARLSGWSVDEAIGRNCRFLQGPATEGIELSKLITAVRAQKPCQLQITNVRKDGSPFLNELSLHPVTDSSGMYRFNVGVLADASRGPSEGRARLRASLPASFQSELQPMSFEQQFGHAERIAQWKQYQPGTSKLIRLLWSTDADGAFRKLLTLPENLSRPAIASVGGFFASKSMPENEQRLVQLITQQMSGAWDAMAGRVDQDEVSGCARS
jgi:PAS domain S-box-containing protein